MNANVTLLNKPVHIEISSAAARALSERDTPLLAEMELLFSCLIRKKVRFRDAAAGGDAVTVNERLQVRFHPVMTAVCGLDYDGEEPPLTDFPVVNPGAFVPDWLKIDFQQGAWRGEFGFA